MFQAVNHFGIRLLASIAAQASDGHLALAPPALYLPFCMLKSVASGATRHGLTRVLGTEEKLAEDERERRLRALRGVLGTAPLTFEGSLLSRGQRAFSPLFLRRAQETYGIPLVTDEGNQPLRLQTRLSATVTLAGTVQYAREGKLEGMRLPADGGLALNFLIPPKAAFWKGRNKPLFELLGTLTTDTTTLWRDRLSATEPVIMPTPELPVLAQNIDLLARLKSLDLGPALTPAADFSLMMVASEAPHLAGVRHALQLQFAGGKALPTRAVSPALWWLEHEPSGVFLALGFSGGEKDD